MDGIVLDGRTILVTGATDGLGRALAGELAQRGATVLVHGRDPQRTGAVAAALGGARPFVADLAELAQVRDLADEVSAATERLDVLVSNAGIGLTGDGTRHESADGYELHFAVNYLAGYLLTRLLLERRPPGRIVNVASAGQTAIDFDDVMLERGYDGWRAYMQSKLAQVMDTFTLAAAGVAANALHPATFMPTKMVVDSGNRPVSTLAQGVEATLRLVTLEGVTGRYFDGTREAAAHPQAYDADARRRLEELSERLTSAA
jgi:NAD(P)-dependent dehydrogenase (short-subunit alcohol dehydrogenase family)